MLDYIVYIGRFQPFHKGHLEIMRYALSMGKHLIVLIGSSQECRSTRNPFTYEERAKMITDWYSPHNSNIIIRPLPDTNDDESWAKSVTDTVDSIVGSSTSIGIVGLNKDDEAETILPLFPKYSYVQMSSVFFNYKYVNATDIREAYFTDVDFYNYTIVTSKVLPTSTLRFLSIFDRNEYQLIKSRFHGLKVGVCVFGLNEKAFSLVIKRKENVSTCSMIGGKVDPNETLKQAVLREFFEETGIQLTENQLSKEPVYQGTEIDGFYTFVYKLQTVLDIPKFNISPEDDRLLYGYWELFHMLELSPFKIFNQTVMYKLMMG